MAGVSGRSYAFDMSAKPTPKERDLVAEALAKAPIDERSETDEERRKVADARAALARGDRTHTQDEIEARIAERRRRSEGG